MTTTSPDQEYSAGTVDNDPRHIPLFAEGDTLFVPEGKKTGHGAGSSPGSRRRIMRCRCHRRGRRAPGGPR